MTMMMVMPVPCAKSFDNPDRQTEADSASLLVWHDACPWSAHRWTNGRVLTSTLSLCLHQVVEALMCMFAKDVSQKRIKYGGGQQQNTDTIRGDVSCRHSSDPDWAVLVANGCVAEDVDSSKACR